MNSITISLPDHVLRWAVTFLDVDSFRSWSSTCRASSNHQQNGMLVAGILERQRVADLPLKMEFCRMSDLACAHIETAEVVRARDWICAQTGQVLMRHGRRLNEYVDWFGTNRFYSADLFDHQIDVSPTKLHPTLNPFALLDVLPTCPAYMQKALRKIATDSIDRIRAAPMSVFRQRWFTDINYRRTGQPTAGLELVFAPREVKPELSPIWFYLFMLLVAVLACVVKLLRS